MTNAKTLMAIAVIALLSIAGIAAYAVFGGQKMQAAEPTKDNPNPPPAGYVPFPIGTVAINLKDGANPSTALTSTTMTARVYGNDVADSAIKSSTTGYLDTDASDANGAIALAGKQMKTATPYKIKIYDTASAPVYYPQLLKVTTDALDANLGASAQDTLPNVLADKIGTIADPMTADATGAGGATIDSGAASRHAANVVQLNQSNVTSATTTIRFTLNLGDTATGSKLKNMVLKPAQDTTHPMPTTAFTAATLTYVSGSNFNVPSNILSQVQNQEAIPLGDWNDGTSGSYYLQVSISNSSLSNLDAFRFYLDDNGGYLGTDDVAGQSGASSQNILINSTLA